MLTACGDTQSGGAGGTGGVTPENPIETYPPIGEAPVPENPLEPIPVNPIEVTPELPIEPDDGLGCYSVRIQDEEGFRSFLTQVTTAAALEAAGYDDFSAIDSEVCNIPEQVRTWRYESNAGRLSITTTAYRTFDGDTYRSSAETTIFGEEADAENPNEDIGRGPEVTFFDRFGGQERRYRFNYAVDVEGAQYDFYERFDGRDELEGSYNALWEYRESWEAFSASPTFPEAWADFDLVDF